MTRLAVAAIAAAFFPVSQLRLTRQLARCASHSQQRHHDRVTVVNSLECWPTGSGMLISRSSSWHSSDVQKDSYACMPQALPLWQLLGCTCICFCATNACCYKAAALLTQQCLSFAVAAQCRVLWQMCLSQPCVAQPRAYS
jgi:hypothetical protein